MHDEDFLTVPILADFDPGQPIGEMRIKRSALPLIPGFHFGIGYQQLEAVVSGVVVKASGYKLVCVSLVPDPVQPEVAK